MSQPISSFTAQHQILPAAPRTTEPSKEESQESVAIQKWRASGLKIWEYALKYCEEVKSLDVKLAEKKAECDSVYKDISNTLAALNNCEVEEITLLSSLEFKKKQDTQTALKKASTALLYELALQRACLKKYPYKLLCVKEEIPKHKQATFKDKNNKTITISIITIIVGFSINDRIFLKDTLLKDFSRTLPPFETSDFIAANCESAAWDKFGESVKKRSGFSPLLLDSDLSNKEANWKILNQLASQGERNFFFDVEEGKNLYIIEEHISDNFLSNYHGLISTLNEKLGVLWEDVRRASHSVEDNSTQATALNKQLESIETKRTALTSQLQEKRRIYSILSNEYLDILLSQKGEDSYGGQAETN